MGSGRFDVFRYSETRVKSFLLVLILCSACQKTPPAEVVVQTQTSQGTSEIEATPAAQAAPAAAKEIETPEAEADQNSIWRHPAPERLIGIGDVHGDLAALKTILQRTGLIDEDLHWVGGNTWLVQTGDLLDRGPTERAVIDLMLALRDEAQAAGGRVIQLNGNHELMNAAGDLRYVTNEGFLGFADIPSDHVPDRVPEEMRGRVAAFMPGGPYALRLAKDGIITQVGDTVFVHGGVTPEHVQRGITELNAVTRSWLLGNESRVPEEIVVTPQSPVWTRRFSLDTKPEDCRALAMVLDALGAKRMVVGHTVQKGGITRECNDHVWRIDTGMSAYYGGKPQALEVTAEGPRIVE